MDLRGRATFGMHRVGPESVRDGFKAPGEVRKPVSENWYKIASLIESCVNMIGFQDPFENSNVASREKVSQGSAGALPQVFVSPQFCDYRSIFSNWFYRAQKRRNQNDPDGQV
jgi:hypothetical protein